MVSSRSENNTIRVSVKNTTNVTKANASSINSSNPVNASNNQAKLYEQQALSHANTSKYWAEQSESSALKSENYANQSMQNANLILQNEKFIAVSENLDNINTVGENIENVITIAEDLDVVADSLDVINNVNDNLEVITSVNSNVENINTVASNIEDIQNAEENANIAKEKAQESFNYSELSKHYSEVSKAQADIATSKTNEVVEKGNTAITEIEALGNEKIDVITVQTEIAITKASEASQSASNALKSSQNSTLSEANAKESENNAKTSETNALNSANIATQQAQIAKDEVAKLSTVYKYKGSVATINNLPTNANVGDVYDTQETGMNYAWDGTEWDELGGTFDVSWGSLKGNISDNADLQTALNNKANNNEVVHLSNNETITGVKTFNGKVNFLGNGDSNAVYLSENTRINVHGTTRTVLGFATGTYLIGHSNYYTLIRGKGERPYWGTGSNISTATTLALTSDIPNVSNFITMSDVEAKGYLTSVPSEYVTENELSTKGYLTEHQDISNLATKTELEAKQDTLTAGENIEIVNNVISAKSGSMPIGTIIPVNANENYVPDGTLPCDGAEYTREQFEDFCKNYLDKSASLLDTCSYEEYEQNLATYGQCAKFGVKGENAVRTSELNTTASVDVNAILFAQLYPNGADLIFTYNGTNWLLDGVVVDLNDFHITITGTPTAGDYFPVVYGAITEFRVPLIKDTETVVTNNVDYANGVTLTATPIETAPFTAPFDGVFISSYYTPNQNGYAYINGLQTAIYHADSDGTTVTDNYIIPLAKDDVLYWEKSFTFKSGAFYPYKEETKDKLFKSFVVVANGQTNQSLMDWSAWASSLQSKMNADHSNDTKPYIVEVSDKTISPSWYRVWSDGWCEQGGIVTGTKPTVTFIKPFINTNYYMNWIFQDNTNTANLNFQYQSVNSKTSSSAVIHNSGSTSFTMMWEAKGYIS